MCYGVARDEVKKLKDALCGRPRDGKKARRDALIVELRLPPSELSFGKIARELQRQGFVDEKGRRYSDSTIRALFNDEMERLRRSRTLRAAIVGTSVSV
jgi:hypothetical protein